MSLSGEERPPAIHGVRPVLSVRRLSAVFADSNGGLQALADVSFAVEAGEFVCVLGPSGCGKSTLLRILAGLLRPAGGEVCFNGEAVSGPRRQVGFVFQKANLMPWRTALENILLPLEVGRGRERMDAEGNDEYLRKAGRQEIRRKTSFFPAFLRGLMAGRESAIGRKQAAAMELVRLVGLQGFENALPRSLSGGMAQRVAIARALMHDPEVLLLDEPFGSLDALTRERMGEELLRIWQARQKTVVMVTHSVSEALFLADRVLVFSPRPGRLLLDLPVKLPRPRREEMRYSPDFAALAREVVGVLRGG